MNNSTTIIRRVKFDDQRLANFFKMLNQSKVGNKIYSNEFGWDKFYPLSAIQFSSPEKLAEIKGLKANVIFVLDAGTSYDGYPNSSKTNEQRIEEAQPKIAQLEIELNRLLNDSYDQLFTMLKCEVVNKTYQVSITRKDYGDDGYDHYGIMLFLKFSYK